MLFETSYDTTVGSIYAERKKTELAIREAMISADLSHRSLGVTGTETTRACFVVGSASEVLIPAFAHPMLVKDVRGKDYVVTDLRLFLSKVGDTITEKEFEKSIRNRIEYNLVKSRAILNLSWVTGEQDRIRSRFSFAGNVFAAWLSNAISRTYALDFGDQATIQAISLYFYHSLFTEEKTLSGEKLETAVIHTIKATKLPAKEITDLFAQIEQIASIADYCEVVKKITNNIRLRDFNIPMLLTLVKNTWYGTNAKDLIQVALEHPPTWLALVYAGLTERTYKNSALSKIIESQGRRGGSEEFRQNFISYIADRTMALESVDLPPLMVHDFKD